MAEYTYYDVWTIAAYVLLLAINYGAVTGVYGRTNKEIRRQYPNALNPAAWTFTIRAVILIGQGASVAYLMYRPDEASQKQNTDMVKSICVWWIVGWIAESVWQLCLCIDTPLSHVFCSLALPVATVGFVQALLSTESLNAVSLELSPQSLPKVVMVGSTAINAAWLTIESAEAIMATAVMLTKRELMPLAFVLLDVVAAVGVVVVLWRSSVSYAGTIMWALLGLYAHQPDHLWLRRACVAGVAGFAALGIVAAMPHPLLFRSISICYMVVFTTVTLGIVFLKGHHCKRGVVEEALEETLGSGIAEPLLSR